jgi:hypothetical protein
VLYLVLPFFVPVSLRAAELQVERVGIVVDELLDGFVVAGWGLSALVDAKKSSRSLGMLRDRLLRVQQYALRQRANEKAG